MRFERQLSFLFFFLTLFRRDYQQQHPQQYAAVVQAFVRPSYPQRRHGHSKVSTRRPHPTTIATTTTTMLAAAATPITTADLDFLAPDTTGIAEPACLAAAAQMQRVTVPVSPTVSGTGTVGISYIHWPVTKNKQNQNNFPPLILTHGFDSSGLEYRRLGPKLQQLGIECYAVDLLGWGYTQLVQQQEPDQPPISYSAAAKIEALQSFVDNFVLGGANNNKKTNQKFCVAGASLGGAAAIELAAAATTTNSRSNSECAGLILIDAQGFVDGIGPMALLPTPLAKLGVQLLQSIPLRSSANQMSYYDTDTYATEEAQIIGRIHTLRPGWSDAMVSFMQSGGFTPSAKVAQVPCPALVVWGRQDGILDGTELAPKFLDTLPGVARLEWIEDCGHVPHLEQPDTTATAIYNFLSQDVAASSSSSSSSLPFEKELGNFVSKLFQ